MKFKPNSGKSSEIYEYDFEDIGEEKKSLTSCGVIWREVIWVKFAIFDKIEKQGVTDKITICYVCKSVNVIFKFRYEKFKGYDFFLSISSLNSYRDLLKVFSLNCVEWPRILLCLWSQIYIVIYCWIPAFYENNCYLLHLSKKTG